MLHTKSILCLGTTAAVLLLAVSAHAADASAAINSGDTSWLLTSSALVLLMTAPGLALFYGGMVRRKNVLAMLMQSFILAALVSVQWILFGYSLAFSPGNALIGSLHWIGLHGVSATQPYADYAPTVPHQAYMIFQCMFAVITPALITGAFAERISFKGFLVFSLLWMTFIYDPLAHWVWGIDGWLHRFGVLDFAGGTVVHISSGTSALAAVLVIGPRRGFMREPMPPHNLTLTLIGAGLLWFGWFGFNAGSALAANGLATSAFVATHIGAAAAALGWVFAEWLVLGKPTTLGVASGVVAGLVAITPASGYVGPMSSIVIGLGAGVLCFFAVRMKTRFGYDDALDVVGVHAVGGIWGALATGLFASVAVNAAGADGLFFGNPLQFLIQIVAVMASIAFAFLGSLVLLGLTDALVG
ncbi:MAG: ammonium transporter, partial [Candidatus Binataceae bacterium]